MTDLFKPATTRERIQAKQRERRGGHEPCDVGLFSSERDQLDLVDKARAHDHPAGSIIRECRECGETYVPANGPCPCRTREEPATCVRCLEIVPCPCSRSWRG